MRIVRFFFILNLVTLAHANAQLSFDALGTHASQDAASTFGGGFQFGYSIHRDSFIFKPFFETTYLKNAQLDKADEVFFYGLDTLFPLGDRFFVSAILSGANVFSENALAAGFTLGFCYQCDIYGAVGKRYETFDHLERVYIRGLRIFGNAPLTSISIGMGFVY